MQFDTARAHLVVRVSGGLSDLAICLSNGGPAIPMISLAAIFDPFRRRRPASATEHARGAGLGLYIAREIVNAGRGRIDVESSEANGTRFTVRLPRR